MNATKLAFIAASTAWLLVITAAPEAAQDKSVNDGVFTDAQVARGEASYRKECNSCHGEGLEGDGFAPGLAGAEFMSNWNGTTIGDLYDRIRISMPPGNPAAVPPQVKADIIAFMLKANKFPTGQAELTVDTLKPIKFELPK